MRMFIAIDFPREVKHRIRELQSLLRTDANAGRWKYIDNFHLTLKFLGEVDTGKMSDICGILHSICRDTAKFKLNVTHLDTFPGNGCLRVLYLALMEKQTG